MAKLFNRAKMTTTTTGSGTITLGSASNGFQSFADAGVANGDVVQYVIEEGANFEIGTGTYSATGTSLTRTPSESSNSDNAITLAGQATVSITAVADDLNRLQHNGTDKVTVSSTGASVTGNLAVSGTVDGVDISARDAVLTSTTTTANAALPKAGGTMTGKLKIEAHTASSATDYETKAEIGNLDISSHGYSGTSHTSFYPDNGNWGSYYYFGGGSSGGAVRDAIRLYVNGNTPANSKIEVWNGTSFNKVFHDGYHPNADKWTSSRTLSLTGGVTGSVSWDGSANASLTSTVALATASAVGGIKIGYSENGKNYPVELDSNGKAFVNVPWTDTNTDTNTTYSLKAQQTGGNNTNPNLLLDANSGTDDTVQLVGSGATTVTRNSDGQITISSTDTNTNTNQLTTFQLEDGDGTEVTISHGKEVKFVEGGGIDINWTDTSNGTDGDPYDLTFTHADTSSQGNVDTSGSVIIDSVQLDTYGHVTNIGTRSIDQLRIFDNRAAGDVTPDGLPDKTVYFTFTDDLPNTGNTWDSVINMAGWGNGYRAWQLASNSGNGDGNTGLYFRSGEDSSWGTMQRVFADDYHPNADKWTTARTHTVTLTGDVTGSASQSVDGTGNKTWSIATTLQNQGEYAPRKAWTSTLTKDVYKRVARVEGDNLASTIRFSFTGTTGSVVVATIADIIVNHSADIHVQTQSGAYTQLTYKIHSNGSNEDFDLYVKYTTGSGTSLPLRIEAFPLGNEVVTSDPTATAYTGGTELEFASQLGVRTLQSSGNSNIRTDGWLQAQEAYLAGNLYHDGDTNTYIGFHASDQWRVVTGGAERLEVNNDYTKVQNSVAILNGGTIATENTTALHVTKGAAGEKGVKITNQDGDAHTWLAYTNGSNYITSDADNTDGSTYIRKEAGGTYDDIAKFDSSRNTTLYGTLTLPDYIYHQGDTNTYMQFNAADTWRVVTGGSQRFLVNNNGAQVNNGRLLIDADNNADGALRIENNVTNTNNDFYFAQEIVQNLSGSQAATADREQGGIYMDINSSNTGGDTSNEHRAYGIYLDLDSTGDADDVVGIYSNVTATPTTGTATSVRGGYFWAEDNGGAGNVTNIYGIQSFAYSDNSNSDTDNMYAGYFKSYNAADTGNIGSAHGVYSEVEITAGSGDHYGTTYVYRAELDNNDVAQTNTTYLFYGNYAGTLPTTAYGVYIADTVDNYFAGSLQVGDQIKHAGDTNTYMQFHAADQWRVVTGGTERLEVTNSQMLVNNDIRVVDDAGIHIQTDTNGAGAKITMSDNSPSGGQFGTIEYRHTDTQSFGAGNTFKFFGSEPSMSFHVAGNGLFTGNVATAYSDERLKDFDGKIEGALDKLSQLNGYYYHANDTAVELGYDKEPRQVGVSAQEVEAVMPEVIAPAAIDPEYKTVHYDRLVPLLIEAIKELKAEVEELKRQ